MTWTGWTQTGSEHDARGHCRARIAIIGASPLASTSVSARLSPKPTSSMCGT
jgi:hypothetical protein